MKIDSEKYVPILKWRQGEYQALFLLASEIKDSVVPLVIIPPREFDFEENKMKKTVHEHVETFPKRLKQKWSTRLALIDTHESLEDEKMDDGRLVIEYVLEETKSLGCEVVPVVGLKRRSLYLDSAKAFTAGSGCGIALRIRLDELNSPTVSADVNALLKYLSVPWDNVDLIVDLGDPGNFQPYQVFAKVIAGAVSKIAGCKSSRSTTFVGTSLKLSNVKKPGATQPRHEWSLYKELRSEIEKYMPAPSFGDYSIEAPDFAEGIDMRMVKPGGKIVYTTIDSWFIPKGGAFRTNTAQMIGHCNAIISSGHYMNRHYCKGDERIEDTANKVKNCGSLTTWKGVGVNHHITFVVRQIAKQYGT